MLFVVQFTDAPGHEETRTAHMAAHLAFLDANKTTIHAAGPLIAAGSPDPAGGLWLVEAPDAGTVEALVEADPFWPTGLRQSVTVSEWRQVFRDGQRQI